MNLGILNIYIYILFILILRKNIYSIIYIELEIKKNKYIIFILFLIGYIYLNKIYLSLGSGKYFWYWINFQEE